MFEISAAIYSHSLLSDLKQLIIMALEGKKIKIKKTPNKKQNPTFIEATLAVAFVGFPYSNEHFHGYVCI